MKHAEKHPHAGRRAALLAITAGVALLTAACGGSPPSAAAGSSSAAAGGSSTSTSPTSSADAAGNQLLAFAQCMRSHGVTDYPDSGDVTAAPGSDLDPSNPTYQTARQACEYLHPTIHQNHSQAAQSLATGLNFSKCMRKHGITNYPDPGPHSGPNGGYGINLSGIDTNSPQFQAAQQTCQQQYPNAKA
jgi:hypothetical protein